jgi:hypothetical protein
MKPWIAEGESHPPTLMAYISGPAGVVNDSTTPNSTTGDTTHRTAMPSTHPASSRRKPCDPALCPPLRSFPTRPDPVSVVLGLQTWF